MSKVVSLAKHKNDPVFMQCPCVPEGGTVTAVVIFEGGKPLITNLVCIECECGYEVVNGFVDLEAY